MPTAVLGIIHQFTTVHSDQAKLVKRARLKDVFNVGAAIGVTGDYLERAQVLVVGEGANVLCVDVAHGHSPR